MRALSRRARTTERSQIRTMKERAKQDEDVVRLEVGDPNFDTPPHIIEAAFEAARNGATHYTSDAGIRELRVAIADAIRLEQGVDRDPDTEIVVSTSGNEAIQLALLATVDEGTEVVVVTPAWPNYSAHIKAVGATPVPVAADAERGFDLDPSAVVDSFTEETAAVIITAPSNPTGRVYDERAVRAVVEAADDHDMYVVTDEVYDKFIFDEEARAPASYLGDAAHVISVNSFSKRYAMTGWRVGWLTASAEVATAAKTLHQACTSCAPTISQHAALAGLTGPQEPIEEMIRAYRERRDFVVERVAEIPDVSCAEPEGGFYAFLDVRAFGPSSLEVAERLLTEYGVLTVPGIGFGEAGEGHLRVSFTADLEALRMGLDRIEQFAQDASVVA